MINYIVAKSAKLSKQGDGRINEYARSIRKEVSKLHLWNTDRVVH